MRLGCLIFLALLTPDALANPQALVIAAVTSAVAVGVQVAVGTIATFTFAAFAKTFAITFVANALLGALAKPKDRPAASFAENRRTQTIRSTVEARRLAYGEVLLSGPIVFAANTGDNGYRHLVVALATHRVESVGDIYFNDELVGTLDGSGNVTTGRFAGEARVKKRTGSLQQTADADLIAEFADKWTASHRGRGIADLYVRTTTNHDIYLQGWVTPRAVVKGRRLFDPRVTAISITSSAIGTPGVFTTGAAHGLAAGDECFIVDHAGAAPAIGKRYEVNTAPTTTTFTLLGDNGQPLAITTGGSGGTVYKCWFSRNPALAVADYLLDPFGLDVDADEINETDLIASANACGERVLTVFQPAVTFDAANDTAAFAAAQNQLRTGDSAFYTTTGTAAGGLTHGGLYYIIRVDDTTAKLATTRANALAGTAIDITSAGTGTHTLERYAVYTADPATDILTLEAAEGRIDTGDGVSVATQGSVPGGLVAGTVYYAIRTGPTTLKLATTSQNAEFGIAIDITSAGSGVQHIRHYDQTRYRLDGTVDLAEDPPRILEEMCSAMAGTAVYAAGAWRILAGYYRTPTGTLDASSLRENMGFRRPPPMKESFNAVRGTYVDPWRYWQPQEFPPVQNAAYVAQDAGEESWRDIVLPFTTNQLRAQRIAKIHLEKSRQGITAVWPCKLSEFAHDLWDVTQVTLSQMGWAGKDFIITNWKLNGITGVDLEMQEEASASYSWAAGEATASDPAPNTGLPDPFTVGQPTGLTISVTPDSNRVAVSWTVATDGFVNTYQVEYKLQADSTYTLIPRVSGTVVDLGNLLPGDYDLRIKAINQFGVSSSFVSATFTVGTGYPVHTYPIISSIISDVWYEQANPKRFDLISVIWAGFSSNPKWVAVGAADGTDAYIVTSPDGLTWTERANPKNFFLSTVAFNGTTLVAVGAADGTDAYIVTSTDGLTWTERANPKNITLGGVCWSESLGLFVAVGYPDGTDAYILTSPDGLSWTERANPKNVHLYAVTWNEPLGLFIAVGAPDGTDAYMVTSPDGFTWTERANPQNIALVCIASNDSPLVVAAGSGSVGQSYIVTSPDGLTWTQRNHQSSSGTPTVQGLAWNGSIFVGVGWSGGAPDAFIVTTSDGVTWTERANPKATFLTDVAWNGYCFVAVGWDDGGDAYILKSLQVS